MGEGVEIVPSAAPGLPKSPSERVQGVPGVKPRRPRRWEPSGGSATIFASPPAQTTRFRVGRVFGDIGDTVFAWDVREFRTSKAAEAYKKKLEDHGFQAFLQVGILRWLMPDQVESAMNEANKTGRWE